MISFLDQFAIYRTEVKPQKHTLGAEMTLTCRLDASLSQDTMGPV